MSAQVISWEEFGKTGIGAEIRFTEPDGSKDIAVIDGMTVVNDSEVIFHLSGGTKIDPQGKISHLANACVLEPKGQLENLDPKRPNSPIMMRTPHGVVEVFPVLVH